MIVMKGVRDARIHTEIKDYDDENTIHTCQENAWCSLDVLKEWHSQVWTPIAEAHPGPKLLLLDSYPLHKDVLTLFSSNQTTVLLIPAGLTFALQPLDSGFFKVLKDELKRMWVLDRLSQGTEKEKRLYISGKLKDAWRTMAEKDLRTFWAKAGLSYPHAEVEAYERNFWRDILNDSSLNESTRMDIEVDNSQNLQ